MPEKDTLLLEVKDLKKHFNLRSRFFHSNFHSVKAVDDIVFFIKSELFGLLVKAIGKSTTARLY